MKRLQCLLFLLLLVPLSCWSTQCFSEEEMKELEVIMNELGNLNEEQRDTLIQQGETLERQSTTLKEQLEIMNQQYLIIEQLQRDVTMQKALLEEEKKSSKKLAFGVSAISILIGVILGLLI